ncbi:MAG: hypothetical protein WB952_23665 [Terriglobales bacterium]
MRKSLWLVILGFGVCPFEAHTTASSDVHQGYQPAVVVSVVKHETPSNYIGGNPADGPLQARNYAYEIGIRLDCDVYVGLYQSAVHYLPSGFAPNNRVDVRLRKHVMYVSLPFDDWDVKMGILSHRRIKNESCSARG